MAEKPLVPRLVAVGEAALARLPLGASALNAIGSARQFKDRNARLLTEVESIGWRLAAIEKRLDVLEKSKRTAKNLPASRVSKSKPGPVQPIRGLTDDPDGLKSNPPAEIL